MKHIILFTFTILSSYCFCQNVGINTISPLLSLDIKGGIRNQPLYLAGSGTSITIPDNQSNINLEVGFSGPFGATVANPVEGQMLIIDNNSGQTGVLASTADILAGLNEYVYSDGEWKTVNINAWGLTGNTNTKSSKNFIGTIDDEPLAFRTNDIERMRLENNNLKIKENVSIELGNGVLNKQTDNGKIAYGAFGSPDELSIVGAGVDPNGLDRKIKLWANGGTYFTGGATLSGSLTTSGEIKPNGASGTSGQVLTNNGNGTMSWAAPPSTLFTLPFSANYGLTTNPAFQINVQNNNTGIEVNNIALSGATEPAFRATSNGTSVAEIESNNASKNSRGLYIHNDLPNAAGIMTSIEVASDSAVALSVSGLNSVLAVNGSSSGSMAAVSILNLGQGKGVKIEQINTTSTQNAMHITSSSKGSALKVEVNQSVGQQAPNPANALEIGNGFIKVDQTAPFRSVFKHVTTASNIDGNATTVFYQGASRSDILFVQKSLPYIGTGVFVWWDPNILAWKISTENVSNMPTGVTFYVLVIKTE